MELCKFDQQTRLTGYIPVPRQLLGGSLPASALLLYGLLLDRATLSQKNGYTDLTGWVYVVYPIQELCARLGLGSTAVKKNLGCLEGGGLIRRLRRSRREANQIYLYLPADAVKDTRTDMNPSLIRPFSVPGKGAKPSPSNRNQQPYSSNCYQHSQEESL